MPSGGGSVSPGRSWRSAATRISSPAISRMRFLTRALRDCQRDAAEPVELRPGLLRAVARQHLDVLDRHEELVVAGVEHLQAIMRRAGDVERLQRLVAADAVLGMDDEIARRQARRLG